MAGLGSLTDWYDNAVSGLRSLRQNNAGRDLVRAADAWSNQGLRYLLGPQGYEALSGATALAREVTPAADFRDYVDYGGKAVESAKIGDILGTAENAGWATLAATLGAVTPLSASAIDEMIPSHRQAQDILDKLKSGRADEVTDDMLGALDAEGNKYLWDNYDLPMDEASRMARAKEMGFDTSAFHGTNAIEKWDVPQSLDPDMGGGARHRTGVFSSSDKRVAGSYATPRTGAVMPLQRKSGGTVISDAEGANWNNLGSGDVYDPAGENYVQIIDDYNMMDENPSTNDIARNVREISELPEKDAALLDALGLDAGDVGGDEWRPTGVAFENVRDHGPYRHELRGQPPAPEQATTFVDFDPRNIRSRFARFDPRLKGLANLLAGGAGLAVLPRSIWEDEDANR